MKLQLNVYENKKIVKTYTEDTYNVLYGTVEDLIDIVDFDKIKKGTDAEIVMAVAPALPKSINIIKPLFKDIFEGLTDEDLRKCSLKEMAKVIVTLVKSTIEGLGASEGKN